MHSSTITDAESGEVICIICGTVVSDKAVEIGQERRACTPTNENSTLFLGIFYISLVSK